MDEKEYSLENLREAATRAERSAPPVSGWSVGMHVHHCCLVMASIVNGLEKSTPPAPRMIPSVARLAVFTTGKIPRGRAKTSPRGTPPPSGTRDELLALIDQSAKHLAHAATLAPDTWITHPILGPLRRDDALKFIRIHNRHHLRIVADILESG